MKLKTGLPVCFVMLLTSCATDPQTDPLHNTKKLAKEGHTSLYQSGALQIPATSIMLIPAGPTTTELAFEMAGFRAQQSFKESIKHAKESVELTKRGINKSTAIASDIHQGTSTGAKALRSFTTSSAGFMADAPATTTTITSTSLDISVVAGKSLYKGGATLADNSLDSGSNIIEGGSSLSKEIWSDTLDSAQASSERHTTSAKIRLKKTSTDFITAYAAVPGKLGTRAENISESVSSERFVAAYSESAEWREEKSGYFSTIMVDTVKNYTTNIGRSFDNAKHEFSETDDTGTLAALKSMRWALQGIFWDGLIAPAGKLGAASVGYLSVNAVAFPVMVVVREGVATTSVAVEVVWNTGAGAYEIIAPTASAAIAGLFSAAEYGYGKVAAGTKIAAGGTAAAGINVGSKLAGGTVATTGYASGKTIQYVGAPLATAGIAATGTAIGVVAGGTQAAVGAAGAAGGATTEVATQVVGNTLAAATLVGGSSASVVAGGIVGGYELGKAVLVPAGYELGAGLVLSYGTLSQLSAQTLLAVADASYMVLSLEGPRWVLYAVKGDLSGGDDIPVAAVLDLNEMKNAGETVYRVPASEEELKRVVDSIYNELPKQHQNQESPPF